MRLKPTVTACALAAITLLLYAFRLTAPPITPDELAFNTRAQSIRAGSTPLFFHVRDERWLQPAAVYANAALRLAGGDDVSGRIASAILGAVNVALVFLIAHLITGRTWVGVIASVILMLTPAHWSLAQLGTDSIFPAPLILLWLWHLLRFFKWDSMRSLAAAAVSLGLCAYAHPAGPLTAAFLWVLSLIMARRRNRVRLALSTLTFAAAWLPAAWWFFRHPDTYADTFGRWLIFAAHLRDPIALLQAFINSNTLGTRTSLYWGFWDPSWLFFSATGVAAPLLLVAWPLIVLGILRCVRQVDRDTGIIVIAAALIVPVVGATLGVPHYINDAAAVLPLLAILAGLGVDQLVAMLTRRQPLQDGVAVTAVDGWNGDDVSPRA
jgi:4-amino-4-deoxy-L-arabinose transferase-like glycosyltransferase